MKVMGLNGREYNLDLKKYSKQRQKCSYYHHLARELLHDMKPIDAMTEKQAIEYLIMKDIPQHIWRDYEKSNKPRLVI